MLNRNYFIITTLFLMIIPGISKASIFGEENIPLTKLVLGQVMELERLAETLEVAKEQRELLLKVNDGINQVTTQIDTIDEIARRAQGLDPKNIRRVSELTEMIEEAKYLKRRAQDVVQLKLSIIDQSIAQSALQSETAYTMGQEMIKAGSHYSQEALSASPGRAAQISAAAQGAQTLSSGVSLQILAHIAQLQALNLDLQKTQIEKGLIESRSQSEFFRAQLMAKVGRP